jgi:hypothetical protein
MRLFCADASVLDRTAIYTAPVRSSRHQRAHRDIWLFYVLRFVMDVTSIASLATNLSAAKTEQQVGIAVLKKAMDVESAGAVALINAIPSAANLPANLGQNINIAV